MSHELYAKRGWSNKDGGLKRSWEIHCHKKATWFAFGTIIQCQMTFRCSQKHLYETIPRLTPEIRSPPSFQFFDLQLLFLSFHMGLLHLLSHRSTFPCSLCFTRRDDMLRDCHCHDDLVLIDKTVSNASSSVTNVLFR